MFVQILMLLLCGITLWLCANGRGLLCCVVVSLNWLALCLKHSSASGGLWGAHSGVTGGVAEEKSTALPEVGGCDDVAPLSGNSGL